MNWDNLKDTRCPKCRAFLVTSENFYVCSECDFKISEKKFDSMVNKLYRKGLLLDELTERDNLSELNNL